jgi:hypothetical protein
MTTGQFYQLMVDRSGGATVVDKTGRYILAPGCIERAELLCAEPFYVHLVRDPRAVIRSYVEMRMDRLLGGSTRLSVPQLAEATWVVAERNARRFLAGIPRNRQHHLRYEDLLSAPEATMRSVCEAAGIRYEPEVVQPYHDRERKMVDGLYSESRMLGDPKFSTYASIEASAADRWRADRHRYQLGHLTIALAREQNYDVDDGTMGGSPERS